MAKSKVTEAVEEKGIAQRLTGLEMRVTALGGWTRQRFWRANVSRVL